MASMRASVTFVSILLITVAAEREIPEFLHICNVREANYEECVVNSIEYLKPYLSTGVPEYNLPSLEPLDLNGLAIARNSMLRIHLPTLDVYNASDFKVKKLKVDIDNLHNLQINLDVMLPILHIEGQYSISGKLMLLPIRGSGPLHGNFSNSIGTCRIHAEKYIDENGKEKIRITEFKMKVTVGKGSLQLDDLFGGEQVIGEVINSAINNSFDTFLKEVSPFVEKALSDRFRQIADNIVEQFTFAQLFPGA